MVFKLFYNLNKNYNLSKNYDNDNAMTSFCSLNNLTSLMDQPTCYNNPGEPTCIDLILTSLPNYF